MADEVFEIVRKIKVLSGKQTTKELNIIRWKKMAPVYDIRKWEDGKPKKGISLSKEEAQELYAALGAELEE